MKKINILVILSIVFIIIAFCISFSEDFLSNFFNEDIIILIFYIIGITGIIFSFIALRFHKRESKKFSIFSVSLVVLILMVALLLTIFAPCQCGSRSSARDARRQSDIRQINLAMDMYYKDNNQKYLQSETLPASVGNYLATMPTNPVGSPCSFYQWISNMNDPQKYCVWACLEKSKKFIVVSPKGIKTLDKAPTSLNCW